MTIDQVEAWMIILVVLVVAILARMVTEIITQVERGKTKRLKEQRKILALQVRQAELAQAAAKPAPARATAADEVAPTEEGSTSVAEGEVHDDADHITSPNA